MGTLKKVNINSAGAGQNLAEAETPVVIEIEGKGRVIVFSVGSGTSGIPLGWAASDDKPGLNLLKDFSDETVRNMKEKIQVIKQHGDIVIVSIHWGSNWGYDIPKEQIEFAHKLIDDAGVEVIHGHSSHHAKGVEVYKERLIIYGCGDFLNDYEGIGGHESFKAHLTLMYFVSVDPLTGKFIYLHIVPMQIKHFKLNRVSKADALWLRNLLDREGKNLRTKMKLIVNNDNILLLK